MSYKFPNTRKIIIPDPGMEIGDLDLDSADLRIVTWESDCKEMKAIFAAGEKPYVICAREYYHDPSITKHHDSYYWFKKLCHSTNYIGKPPTIAAQCHLTVGEVERIQGWYFGKFPEIKRWQERLLTQIERTASVSNVWGYRIKTAKRVEGNVINELVAWIPQSTVGILINKALINIDAHLPQVEILLQTHDSLTFQFPLQGREGHLDSIITQSTIAVPYKDPLVIPVGVKTSPVSYGDCK